MTEENMSIKVLLRAEEFEKILKDRFGAKGEGLGQYVHSVEDKLGRRLKRKLLDINTERNKAAHSPSLFRLEDPESFFRERRY